MRQQLTSAEIIAKLVEMTKEISEEAKRGERFEPTLSNDDLADIAREIVTQVRRQLKPDWISHEPVRAKLRTTIKRLLARRSYPPTQAPKAIELVLKQMEYFANEWSQEDAVS